MLGGNILSSVLYIVLAVLVLLLMVLIHELGHYTAGRILKFKIEEFSVGFGKAIFSKTNKRGEKISLRIFPLGGYCAFKGEGTEKDDSDPEAFVNQKPWKRIIVLFMGAFFNFLSAIIFSFILLVSFGYDIKVVDTLSPDSINTNLQKGDIIWEVNDEKVDFAFSGTMQELVAKHKNEEGVTLTIERNGEIRKEYCRFYDTTNADGSTTRAIGIQTVSTYRYSFGKALLRAVPMAVGFAWLVLKSLWLLITFQIPITALGGTITTISVMAESTSANIANLFIFLPLIAANLAMFNLLPFPALDGAHILFTTIEWIRKKPINRKVENMIHTIGLFVLLAFVVVVDIIHFVV